MIGREEDWEGRGVTMCLEGGGGNGNIQFGFS